LHGFYSHGFPNCFHLGITQNTLTPNFPHMLDEQARHVAEVVRQANLRQAQKVEPSTEAEAGWVQTIRDNALQNLQFRSDCTPGYYNGEGQPTVHGRDFLRGFPFGATAYFQYLDGWRTSGTFDGLDFRGERDTELPRRSAVS
jgi:hypothetical protein